jgi:AbrB family looped-hinge helix DNA binding protein
LEWAGAGDLGADVGWLLVGCQPMYVRWYLTRMRTTISTKGQIVLPAELRAADGIQAGEEFEVDRLGPDEYRLTRLTPPPNRGLVEWLRSCPEDGWFVEIESESTDSL